MRDFCDKININDRIEYFINNHNRKSFFYCTVVGGTSEIFSSINIKKYPTLLNMPINYFFERNIIVTVVITETISFTLISCEQIDIIQFICTEMQLN